MVPRIGSWIQQKIYLYNVTFGLYMLDWWERYLFNTLMIILLWFICYNGSRSAAELYKSFVGRYSSPTGFPLDSPHDSSSAFPT